MRDKNPTASRAIYDEGRYDTFNGVPIHETPVTSSSERMHELTNECWCNPTVEYVPASRVRHRRAKAIAAVEAL